MHSIYLKFIHIIQVLLSHLNRLTNANINGVARMLNKLRASKGDYWSSNVSLQSRPFQMETSLKGKNLLPEGANSFLYEQFHIVRKSLLSH